MRDYQSKYDAEIALAFNQITADTDGEIIDLKDCNGADIVIVLGDVTTADGSNYFAPVVKEGAAANLSDAAAVAADDLIVDNYDNEGPTPGATPNKVNNTNLADTLLCRISYRGTKRYIRLTMDETGTADAQVGAIVNKFGLGMAPNASSF